jgi:hypothetical protein
MNGGLIGARSWHFGGGGVGTKQTTTRLSSIRGSIMGTYVLVFLAFFAIFALVALVAYLTCPPLPDD